MYNENDQTPWLQSTITDKEPQKYEEQLDTEINDLYKGIQENLYTLYKFQMSESYGHEYSLSRLSHAPRLSGYR